MKKILVLSGVIVLLAALGVGGAYFYHIQKVHKGISKAPTLTLGELAKLQVALPQVTTNSNDGHLIQTTLTIQALNKTTFTDLTAAQSQILDIINGTIHGDSSSEFLSPTGINAFKSQLLTKIKAILPKTDSVSEVDVDSMIEQ